LADAKLHFHCLIACAQEVMEAYEARKKALGLIDYADMIAGAERLLRTDPAVRQAVLDEIDCVIIDEFQDTNPVQFALLWQLGAHAPRTLLVGDVKQSIMGFQGADPRLSQALAAANPDATQPLDLNWRSTPAVMDFVNAMGAGLFGAGYNPLSPTRDPVPGPALEVLNIVKGRGVRNVSKPQEHIAERIARILTTGETVTDRHTKATRAVRPSDIALLVCRHATAARYAEELRARGVPVRIAEDGWAASTVVQAARAALSYAANPADTHSALILRTLGPDPLSLQAAMTAQIQGRLADDPVLMRLAALSDRLGRLPISNALDLVLNASGLRLWADCQPDAAQARADLLRLEAEASDF
jgi:ATP-dependent exoDNAse (exonuclease V) beta subunit